MFNDVIYRNLKFKVYHREGIVTWMAMVPTFCWGLASALRCEWILRSTPASWWPSRRTGRDGQNVGQNVGRSMISAPNIHNLLYPNMTCSSCQRWCQHPIFVIVEQISKCHFFGMKHVSCTRQKKGRAAVQAIHVSLALLGLRQQLSSTCLDAKWRCGQSGQTSTAFFDAFLKTEVFGEYDFVWIDAKGNLVPSPVAFVVFDVWELLWPQTICSHWCFEPLGPRCT